MKETRGVTSGSEGRRPPPLFLLPKLHKDKDKPAHTLVQKDALTISCMVIFFVRTKAVAEEEQDGGRRGTTATSADGRYVSTLLRVFLRLRGKEVKKLLNE